MGDSQPTLVNTTNPLSERPGGSGYTILHQAAWHGAPVEVLQSLISRGADIGLQTFDNLTPQGVARENNHSVTADNIMECVAAKGQDVPIEFVDPILGEIMRSPVQTAVEQTYEETSIRLWLEEHDIDPLTGLPLPNKDLKPCPVLQARITQWLGWNPRFKLEPQ